MSKNSSYLEYPENDVKPWSRGIDHNPSILRRSTVDQTRTAGPVEVMLTRGDEHVFCGVVKGVAGSSREEDACREAARDHHAVVLRYVEKCAQDLNKGGRLYASLSPSKAQFRSWESHGSTLMLASFCVSIDSDKKPAGLTLSWSEAPRRTSRTRALFRIMPWKVEQTVAGPSYVSRKRGERKEGRGRW